MEWKKNDVYQMTGVSATPGKATSASGVEYDITPELLKTVFNNFDDAIPAYFTHSNREPIGFITDLAYDETDNTIHYKGYIFKKEKERVVQEGFNMVSPEIDNIENPLASVLTGIAYTSRPAMDVGESVCTVMFSEVLDELNEQEEIKVVESVKTQTEGTQEFKPVETVKPVDAASAAEIELAKQAVKGNIEADKSRISELESSNSKLTEEYESTKTQLKGYREKYESILTGEIKALEADLKKSGFDNPEEFAKDLDVETRLEILKSTKAGIAKNTPISAPPDGKIEKQAGDKNDLKSVASKFGIKSDKLIKYL